MKCASLFAALLCLMPALHAEEAPLFNMRSSDRVYEEIERGDNSSTVQATVNAGSAAARSMFLLSASCALLKHRNKEAFVIERLSRDPVRFIVRFVPGGQADDDALQPFKPGSPVSRKRCALVDAMGLR